MIEHEREYTVGFGYGGLGAVAMGFLQAETRLLETRARFRIVGGVDIDPEACQDFEYLTGARETCADAWELTAEDMRRIFGAKAPDVMVCTAPCKGASGLLSEKQSKTAKYRKLNKLALRWVQLTIEAWPAAPPRIFLFENVSRITTRAARMLSAIRAHLRRAGYVIHESTHDAGQLGHLAQHRKRYLMVARHQASVSSLLYQPVKRRVRACGEVLGPLPMPNDPAGGPMHRLPAIGWLNWVRLALIPAGGDWRDLPGVLDEGQDRREKFKRHAVEEWDGPTGTVGGSGSNGVENVADPRAAAEVPECYRGIYGVSKWSEPTGTVTGGAAPARGRFAVADPRVPGGAALGCEVRAGAYGVTSWEEAARAVIGSAKIDNSSAAVAAPRPFKGQRGVKAWGEPAATVTGESLPSNGPHSVADPRIAKAYGNVQRVIDWGKPTGTITHAPAPSSGAPAVADPRVGLNLGPDAHHNVMRVAGWDEPTGTVTGATRPGQGAPSVADPRLIPQAGNPNMHEGKYEVRGFDEPVGTITGATRPGSGSQAVADTRVRAWFHHVLRIVHWGMPAGTVTSGSGPTNGGGCVADPRVRASEEWNRGQGYSVVPWTEPASTVAGGSHPGQGAYSVADPRVLETGLVGLLTLVDARATVTGGTAVPFAVVDPSSDGPPVMVVRDIAKAPPCAPVILAADGTWHRPLTTLELAVLQGLPWLHNGAPLALAGHRSSAHRERIGNAFPVGTAEAIAGQMLITLLSSDLQAFALSSGGGVWVEPHHAETVQ